MKLLIIGGFLGSGKTSVTICLLTFIALHSNSDSRYKAVVLENEIGDIGIDDTALANGGFRVETIFAGCACCTSSVPLLTSVKEVKDGLSPEWLILEATGLAYPYKIKDNLKDALGVDSRVCVIVDAKRWKRLQASLPGMLNDQLNRADVIIINKIDIVDNNMVESVKESIASINPAANIILCNASEGLSDDICSSILRENASL
jgi:G3E family GTPase